MKQPINVTLELEKLNIQYDIKELLTKIYEETKPYDFFFYLKLPVSVAYTLERFDFPDPAIVYKLIVLPPEVDFTLYVNDIDEDSKYEIEEGESIEIERMCKRIYYTNTDTSAEQIRIHCFGRK